MGKLNGCGLGLVCTLLDDEEVVAGFEGMTMLVKVSPRLPNHEEALVLLVGPAVGLVLIFALFVALAAAVFGCCVAVADCSVVSWTP